MNQLSSSRRPAWPRTRGGCAVRAVQRVALGALVALVALVAVAAGSVSAEPMPATSSRASASTPSSAAPAARAPTRPAALKNPRLACGCASSRLLARSPVVLDGATTISAWLHDAATLAAFQQDPAAPGRLGAIDAPLLLEQFEPVGGASNVAGASRFVRVHASAPLAEGTLVGVMRRTDTTPRDVVAVAGAGSASTPPAGPPPVLRALWLAPLTQRERSGCGAWATQMLAYELHDATPPPEAFLVTDVEARRSALVDARAVGAFGIGRVEVCEQGLPLRAGAHVVLEVRPVSAAFGVGDAWRFSSDGTGMTDVVRVASPASADATRIAEPFPIPGASESGDVGSRRLAATVMSGVAGGAVVVALVLWVVIPARRRRLADVVCPACGRKIPVDTLDRNTDGFFCPACGAAGFWHGEARRLPPTTP